MRPRTPLLWDRANVEALKNPADLTSTGFLCFSPSVSSADWDGHRGGMEPAFRPVPY